MTRRLIFPGCLSFIVCLLLSGSKKIDLEGFLLPLFAIVISFLSVLTMRAWKRKEKRLSLEWGTSECGDVNIFRHEFIGDKFDEYLSWDSYKTLL